MDMYIGRICLKRIVMLLLWGVVMGHHANTFATDVEQYFSGPEDQRYWLCNGVKQKLGDNDWMQNNLSLIFEFGEGWVRDFQPGVAPQGHRESTWERTEDGRLTITDNRSPVDWKWVKLEPNDESSFAMTWSRQVKWYDDPQVNIDTWQCERTSVEIAFGSRDAWEKYRVPKVVAIVKENEMPEKSLVPGSDVPFTFKTLQEALDVVFLNSQGQSASEDSLRECEAEDGCTVLGGVLRARYRLREVNGCALLTRESVRCTFRYQIETTSELSSRDGVRNKMLEGVLKLVIDEGDSLLVLTDGKWRFQPEY